jgi:hypothetical protein
MPEQCEAPDEAALARLRNLARALCQHGPRAARLLRTIADELDPPPPSAKPPEAAGAQLGRELEARGHVVLAGRVRTLGAADALRVPPATLRTWRARRQGPASERDQSGEHWYRLTELAEHLKRNRFNTTDSGVIQSE